MESALREKEAKKAAAAAQAEMDQAVSGVDFVTADVGQRVCCASCAGVWCESY